MDLLDVGTASSASHQLVGSAGGAFLAALRGGRALERQLVFTNQKFLADTVIQVIPRHHLVVAAAAVCIERRVDAQLLHRIVPSLRVKVLVPAIQTASLLPNPLDDVAQTAVAFGKDGFDEADVRIVIADADFFGLDAGKQVLLFFPQQLHAVLSLKLEGSERLWNKAGAGDGHADRTSLWTGRNAVIQVDHLLCKVCDSFNVLHRFGRQTHHKVELDRGVAALKRGAAGGQHLLLGDVFVDDIAQALGSCLGCKGQTALL